MEKISFTKMSGAGNDFIVIDKNAVASFELNNTSIQRLCDRRNGIGADGLITIEDSPETDFTMSYYNADGSQSLCGNGARCAIYFAKISGRVKNGKTKFRTNNLDYSGEILGEGKVKLFLNSPFGFRSGISLKTFSSVIDASFINTGSPHVVINLSDIRNKNGNNEPLYSELTDVPVYELGKEIRYFDEFKPGGSNINFIRLHNNEISIRTYERGVENETLACGTGCVASALIGNLIYNLQPPVILHSYGGEDLVVDFTRVGEDFKNLSLSGPANIIYTGEFLLNKFL